MTQDVLPWGTVSAFPDVANNVPCHFALENTAAELCALVQLSAVPS